MGLVFKERRPTACAICGKEPASYVPDLGDLCEACTESMCKESDHEPDHATR